MEYGLRRYESSQRLWWFLFLILVLLGGFPASGVLRSRLESLGAPTRALTVDQLKGSSFWFQIPWIQQDFLGGVLLYLLGVLALCLILRLLWLLAQVGATLILGRSMKRAFRDFPARPKPDSDWLLQNPEKILPTARLKKMAGRFPFSLFSLAHKRLRLLLSGADGIPSSDEMMHREHRLESVDWHLVASSWEPFRWIARLLPLVGLAQSGWVFFLWMQPVIQGTGEMGDLLVVAATSVLAFVQMVASALFFGLASGLLTRLESFYLSRLDGLFYDQLLARLPLHNADTLLLLEALRSQFKELQAGLKRIEKLLRTPSS